MELPLESGHLSPIREVLSSNLIFFLLEAFVRSSLLIPAALVSVGLCAQAPENLVDQYNKEVPAVAQALKDLKYREACAKADALVPAKVPVFNPKEIEKSLDAGKGMLAILKLQANTQAVSGRWEKARDINLQRLDYAQSLKTNLNVALAPLEAAWKQSLDEGKAYLAENEVKSGELEKKLLTLQADVQAFNEKKLKLDSKQMADLKARASQAPKEEVQLDEMKAKIASYKANAARHGQFLRKCQDYRSGAEAQIQEAQAALGKMESSLKGQAAEIEAFNTAQNAKKPRPKVPVQGAKAWVAAVMKDHKNLTQLATPQDQANSLHRLLVLDPENKPAADALANLEQGRDPFYEAKAPQKVRAKKK
ncbi:MAG: hypothetical protein H6Q00_2032 [Holophagaceae bacterium]|nr:hypothetical protein [Holophagaceae bacterium]